jgi:hypothetical protein
VVLVLVLVLSTVGVMAMAAAGCWQLAGATGDWLH